MNRKNRLFLLGIGTTAALGGVLLLMSVGLASPSGLPPQELTEPASGFQGNITLQAPPQGYAPKVSAPEASEVALGRAETVGAEAVQSTLAAFTWTAVPVDENDKPIGPPLYTDAPVWVVTVEGICSELVPDTGECINGQMNFVVDAVSGKFIVAFGSEKDLVGRPI